MVRFISFLTPVLLLPLLDCGGSQHDVQEKYFLISANIKVPYWQEAAAGFNRAAAQMHVHAEFVGPETYDPKAQHEQFQDVLKQKPTGILVSASAPDLLNNDIDAAIAQGVPVIAMDSDAPGSKRLFFIGTDNYQAGVMGARMLAKGLAGKGNVVVFTIPEQANLKDRLRGYTDVFAEHPQIKITQVIDEHGDPGVVFDRTMEMVEKAPKWTPSPASPPSPGPKSPKSWAARTSPASWSSPWTLTSARWKASGRASSQPPSARSRLPWPTWALNCSTTCITTRSSP